MKLLLLSVYSCIDLDFIFDTLMLIFRVNTFPAFDKSILAAGFLIHLEVSDVTTLVVLN